MLKVLPQLDAIIKAKPEDTDFWGPITRMPADFSDAEKQRLTEAYRSMIGERVMPAYQRLRDFIARDYLPACRDTFSLRSEERRDGKEGVSTCRSRRLRYTKKKNLKTIEEY